MSESNGYPKHFADRCKKMYLDTDSEINTSLFLLCQKRN